MQRDEWKSAAELDFWTKEVERLSMAQYAKTDTMLFNVYKEVLDGINERLLWYVENYETLSFSQRLEAERLFKTAGEIDQIIGTARTKSQRAILDYKRMEAILGYESVGFVLESQYGFELAWMGLDQKFLESIIDAPVAGKKLSTRLYQNTNKLAKEATSTITRLTAQGKGYTYIAQRLSDLTEATYKQALRIARTEGGRVRSLTTQKGYKDTVGMGIDLQKRWIATLDRRTRDAHRHLHGETVGVDEMFMSDGYEAEGPHLFGVAAQDVNCRCTSSPVVMGYDIGIPKNSPKLGMTFAMWKGV